MIYRSIAQLQKKAGSVARVCEVLAVSRRKTGRPLREVRGERVKHALGTAVPQLVTQL